MHIFPYDFVCLFVSESNPAVLARPVDFLIVEGEREHLFVSILHFQFIKVQWALSYSGRSSCLHSSNVEAILPEFFAQSQCSTLSKSSWRSVIFSDKYSSFHEGTSCKDYYLGTYFPSSFSNYTNDTPYTILLFDDEVDHSIHKEIKLLLLFTCLFGKSWVRELVSLGTWSLYSWASATVKYSVLYHRSIDQMPHLASKGIYFSYKISLC